MLATFIGYNQNVYTFPTEVTGREIKGMPVVKLFTRAIKVKIYPKKKFFPCAAYSEGGDKSEQEQQAVMEIMTKTSVQVE